MLFRFPTSMAEPSMLGASRSSGAISCVRAVGCIPLALRQNRSSPSTARSLRSAWLTADGVRHSRDAAAETLRNSSRDRKSVVSGKSVSVRVDLGGRRIIKQNIEQVTQRADRTKQQQQH